MRYLLEERRYLNSLRVRREARRSIIAEKRSKLQQLTNEEVQERQAESMQLYESLLLSQQCRYEESLTALHVLNELVSKHSKQLRPDTLLQLVHVLQSTLVRDVDGRQRYEITTLLVSVTSLEHLDPQAVEALSSSVGGLTNMALQSNDLVVIENVLYVIGNLATESTVQKERLTAECSRFFGRLTELIKGSNINYQFCDCLLWVYTNILLRNKRSYRVPGRINREFCCGLVDLLSFLLAQFAGGMQPSPTMGPVQLASLHQTRSRAIRLVALLMTLNIKEEAQSLWEAGLKNCVVSCLVALYECKEVAGDPVLLADILDVVVAACSMGSAYPPVNVPALVMNLLQQQHGQLLTPGYSQALEAIVELVCCCKDEALSLQLLALSELIWQQAPGLSLVHKLSKFMMGIFESRLLDKICGSAATIRSLLRRLASMLDYENYEIIRNALRCLLFLSDREIDAEVLRELLEEVGLTQRLVSLQLHYNSDIYYLCMSLLEILNIQE